MTIAVIIFVAAIILIGLAGAIFRVRAIANKQAWSGPVVPLALVGLVLLLISLVMIYLNYPK
ncbi:hypothetical protein [Enterococcus sp. DIV0187]|uniref:hypothetical protein n=1 Tax=Enterococcus sp. DIV0187 TaxID=2774644 RepID=UPI003F1EB3EE